jgi:hypothetical protein
MTMQDPTRATSRPIPGDLRQYEPPRITVMDEKEVLQAFQITSAGITWWVM